MEPQIVTSFQRVIIFHPCHLNQKKLFFISKESKISHIHSTPLSPLARVAAPPSRTVPVIGGAGRGGGHHQAGSSCQGVGGTRGAPAALSPQGGTHSPSPLTTSPGPALLSIPIFQTRKPRYREVREHAQGHTARKRQNQASGSRGLVLSQQAARAP